jgi:hypothetical protein
VLAYPYRHIKNATETHTITSNDLITHEAQVSEQLVVMCLAVSQALLLIVAVTQERLLTLGTHKMLHIHNNSHYCTRTEMLVYLRILPQTLVRTQSHGMPSFKLTPQAVTWLYSPAFKLHYWWQLKYVLCEFKLTEKLSLLCNLLDNQTNWSIIPVKTVVFTVQIGSFLWMITQEPFGCFVTFKSAV